MPRGPGHHGWQHRGYLPHFDSALTQAVTLHLADSLPKDALEQMRARLDRLPEDQRDEERLRLIEEYADAGHGSCILRAPAIAQMMQDSLRWFEGQRYLLHAWVIMPNHIHVLFRPLQGWTLHKIIASWKKYTARQIRDHLRKANLLICPVERESPDSPSSPPPQTGKSGDLRSDLANQEIRVLPALLPSPVWHPEFWDRYMRDEAHFDRSKRYIHRNPVKAGLVKRPEDWPWSSASRP